MERRQLSRPLYESRPWLYMAFGVAALIASYLLAARGLVSHLAGLIGLVSLVYGMVVVLRRRDYRSLRSQYGNPDPLDDDQST